MNPPDENKTIIKIDDDNFYIATTASTSNSVSGYWATLIRLQQQADFIVKTIQDAEKQGVGNATTVLSLLVGQPLSSVIANVPDISTLPTPPTK